MTSAAHGAAADFTQLAAVSNNVSTSTIILAVVGAVVVVGGGIGLLKFGDWRSRHRPTQEQEDEVIRIFRKAGPGPSDPKANVDRSRIGLPLDRISELAEENGYEFFRLQRDRSGSWFEFQPKKEQS